MAGLWHFTVMVMFALLMCCSPLFLVSSQPADDGSVASADDAGEYAEVVAGRAAAAKDPERGVSVSGLYPEAGGPPIEAAGPLRWFLAHEGKQLVYHTTFRGTVGISSAGKVALAAVM